ncbi:MAG: hypothetical protein J7J36_05270 [Thermoplasmata archaeon]|nr:hypothetical protein [Thermoplasmata archaeon]
MGKRIISLSVDKKVYEKYKEICDKNGWILSKQVENFMVKEINNHKSSSKREEG